MEEFLIRVAIADDHPAILLAVAHVLAIISTVQVMGSAKNSTDLMPLLQQKPCQVLVTDYAMPGGAYGDGLTLLIYLKNHFPELRIVLLTELDNPSILRRVMQSGIHCIVSKVDDMSHLVPALHIARSGGKYLSPTIVALMQSLDIENLASAGAKELSKRELEVIHQYAAGQSISEIAENCHRSKQTISSQKNSAMKKLGITREADLFKYALEIGL